MTPAQTFPLRHGLFRPLLSVLGAGPRFSAVEVGCGRVRARMGLAFRAGISTNGAASIIAALLAALLVDGGVQDHRQQD